MKHNQYPESITRATEVLLNHRWDQNKKKKKDDKSNNNNNKIMRRRIRIRRMSPRMKPAMRRRTKPLFAFAAAKSVTEYLTVPRKTLSPRRTGPSPR